MMNQVVILCVEDEVEVREAVVRDLAPFQERMRIEAAEDVSDAREVLKECEADGDPVGLVLCDHRMPGESGVDFLVGLHDNPRYSLTRKVLITGQAGQEDTIRAVNEADLHHYIAKPWEAEELCEVVRKELTDYVLASDLDPLPFVSILDGPRLLDVVARRGHDT